MPSSRLRPESDLIRNCAAPSGAAAQGSSKCQKKRSRVALTTEG